MPSWSLFLLREPLIELSSETKMMISSARLDQHLRELSSDAPVNKQFRIGYADHPFLKKMKPRIFATKSLNSGCDSTCEFYNPMLKLHAH